MSEQLAMFGGSSKKYAVAVIGCSQEKRTPPPADLDNEDGPDGKLKAQELYCSRLFALSLSYARNIADRVYIASAFFDLVRPTERLFVYDRKMSDLGGKEYKNAWGSRVVSKLKCFEKETLPKEVVLLLGKEYADPIKNNLGRGCKVIEPLGNMQIGQRLSWLTREVRAEVGS